MPDRRIVRPDKLDLDSPGRRDYWVALEHDSIWGDHLIPLTVFVGRQAKPGEGLLATGSNHGNEYEGPVVLKHLIREIKPDDVLGRIILIPVLNPAAFLAGTRESTLDDGVNLNRAFVDGAGLTPALGGITHRIAAFVRQYLWPRVHVVLDLHSGGDVARFAVCANYHPVDDPELSRKIEETARWFGTPALMVYQNLTPGLLPSEAERLGKITVGTELGWGSAVQTEGVRYGRHGVLAAAIHHGQLRGTIEKIAHHRDGTQRKLEMVDRDCFTVAPFAGHYEPIVDCGTAVRRGQTVGYLHDFDHIDADPWPAVAGVDGVVLAQAWVARVPRGQHIVVVGRDIT
jgi:predicted deacylase